MTVFQLQLLYRINYCRKAFTRGRVAAFGRDRSCKFRDIIQAFIRDLRKAQNKSGKLVIPTRFEPGMCRTDTDKVIPAPK